ncbi:VOC family protein [Novosphingobium olei]|uniref:VOC family protein n=1 Tax=Novosphingobium olei TaxID=2728851 RepID=A0A7Y0BNG8_9SPHN|nr:VOC family protein [Novosphingobium olei]NML93732.1 VOC family protein [Novosphingobium olei]BEV00989.1 VOC family protein [Novosphingobium olei]
MTRKIHELGPVGQLAYLPSDFDATLKYWTQTMGVGPFFLMENIQLTDCKYKGVPTDAMFSIAIAYWGDVQIELIRPENREPSIYTGEYAVTDQLHHICIFVDSIAEARAACAEAGAEVLVEGKVGDDGEVIYVDPGARDGGGGPGHVIELLQNTAAAPGLFQMIKDAGKNWDGSEPLRKLG